MYGLSFCFVLLCSSLTVISLSSHRDPKHPSVPYHYYEPSGPDECTMYLSHERGRKGSHHRFITEKRVFKNWARTFNIHFFQPDWKPESRPVNHAEDKPVFWRVRVPESKVWCPHHQPREEGLELQAGKETGQWCPSAPWTEPTAWEYFRMNASWRVLSLWKGDRTLASVTPSLRLFQNERVLMSVVSLERRPNPRFRDTAMARNTPGWKYCLQNRNRSSPTPLIAFLYRHPCQKTFFLLNQVIT